MIHAKCKKVVDYMEFIKHFFKTIVLNPEKEIVIFRELAGKIQSRGSMGICSYATQNWRAASRDTMEQGLIYGENMAKIGTATINNREEGPSKESSTGWLIATADFKRYLSNLI
jgi:hypothetical protein